MFGVKMRGSEEMGFKLLETR